MRKPLVVGNWKMNGTEREASDLLEALLPRLAAIGHMAEVALAPPYTSLRTVGQRLEGTSIALAAQNLHSASHGAFTGEISAAMLSSLGVRFVIVGHSERRHLFGETDEEIGRKVAAARAGGLVPILCVGEQDSERMAGKTIEVILRQTAAGMAMARFEDPSSLVLAYEPVWAIGTGRTASAAQASEAHHALRDALRAALGSAFAGGVRILYGGSVTPATAQETLKSPGVDGALVGGASLVADSFAQIVAAARA